MEFKSTSKTQIFSTNTARMAIVTNSELCALCCAVFAHRQHKVVGLFLHVNKWIVRKQHKTKIAYACFASTDTSGPTNSCASSSFSTSFEPGADRVNCSQATCTAF